MILVWVVGIIDLSLVVGIVPFFKINKEYKNNLESLCPLDRTGICSEEAG